MGFAETKSKGGVFLTLWAINNTPYQGNFNFGHDDD